MIDVDEEIDNTMRSAERDELTPEVRSLFGTRYHYDSVCGACGGVLEVDRDAVCHLCSAGLRTSTKSWLP